MRYTNLLLTLTLTNLHLISDRFQVV